MSDIIRGLSKTKLKNGRESILNIHNWGSPWATRGMKYRERGMDGGHVVTVTVDRVRAEGAGEKRGQTKMTTNQKKMYHR